MQNTISVFSFKSQNVRTQILGAEPWFCLGDVAEILQIQNARQLPLKDQGIQKSSVATKKRQPRITFHQRAESLPSHLPFTQSRSRQIPRLDI